MNQIKRKILTNDGTIKWVLYPFRSLVNYKAMHTNAAKNKAVLSEFMAATTLTAARRILFK